MSCFSLPVLSALLLSVSSLFSLPSLSPFLPSPSPTPPLFFLLYGCLISSRTSPLTQSASQLLWQVALKRIPVRTQQAVSLGVQKDSLLHPIRTCVYMCRVANESVAALCSHKYNSGLACFMYIHACTYIAVNCYVQILGVSRRHCTSGSSTVWPAPPTHTATVGGNLLLSRHYKPNCCPNNNSTCVCGIVFLRVHCLFVFSLCTGVSNFDGSCAFECTPACGQIAPGVCSAKCGIVCVCVCVRVCVCVCAREKWAFYHESMIFKLFSCHCPILTS